MTSGSAELLRALGAGIRPAAADRAGGREPASAIERAAFADLLARAREGTLSSGAPVSVAPGANVHLSEGQLRRLGAAADRAEAMGATRAVVFMDGMRLILDVGVRSVTGLADPGGSGVLTGIDAVIEVPPEAGAGDVAAGPAAKGSLLRALSRRPAA